MNFNQCFLAGNLTRDPELRYTPKGTAVGKISIAVNRTWRNESGEKKEEVTFVELSVFGKQAEAIGQYLRKGSPIFIQGRLKLDQWDDKQTGQKRSKLGVVIESFQFLGGGKDREHSALPSAPAPPATPPPAGSEDQPPLPGEDDVPF